jgi:AcrR family transcriptional regulator
VSAQESEQQPTRLPRGRHGLPRAFVVRSQRERLVAAVADVVSERGYSAMTVADVVERAGVSRRTFYEHFEDKEDALLQAYDVVVAQVFASLEAGYQREENWRDGVRAALTSFLENLAAEPALARMCMVEALAAGPRALARRDRAIRELAELYERGRPNAPHGVSPVVNEVIVAGLYEVVYTRILSGELEDLPELRAPLMYWGLVPYLGHEEARRELGELRDWRPTGAEDGANGNGSGGTAA